MLIYDEDRIDERHFYEVPEILDTGKMLVFNNTKVIYARILFQKVTGAVIEFSVWNLTGPLTTCRALPLTGSASGNVWSEI